MSKKESQLIWEQYTESKHDQKADKDHDGDGEVESKTQEYMGVKDKAIKKAKGEEHDEEPKNEQAEADADEEHEDDEEKAEDKDVEVHDESIDDETSPFDLTDESDDSVEAIVHDSPEVVELANSDRPGGDDRAEMLLDVIKMLEDKTFDYSFDPDQGTMKLKSNTGDEYILKLVGAAGDHDVPVSLR